MEAAVDTNRIDPLLCWEEDVDHPPDESPNKYPFKKSSKAEEDSYPEDELKHILHPIVTP